MTSPPWPKTDEPTAEEPQCPKCGSLKLNRLPHTVSALSNGKPTHITAQCQGCGAVFTYLRKLSNEPNAAE